MAAFELNKETTLFIGQILEAQTTPKARWRLARTTLRLVSSPIRSLANVGLANHS